MDAFEPIFEELAHRLVAAGRARPRAIAGLSLSEVNRLREGLPWMPAAYVSFLRVMGRRAGELSRRFEGTRVFVRSIDEVLDNQRRGREILTPGREPVFTLGVMEHDQVLFVEAHASDDPPVFRFMLGVPTPEPVATAITGYFRTAVDRFLGAA